MNFNVLGFDSREQSMLNDAVLISVSLEVLKERTAKRDYWNLQIFFSGYITLLYKLVSLIYEQNKYAVV